MDHHLHVQLERYDRLELEPGRFSLGGRHRGSMRERRRYARSGDPVSVCKGSYRVELEEAGGGKSHGGGGEGQPREPEGSARDECGVANDIESTQSFGLEIRSVHIP